MTEPSVTIEVLRGNEVIPHLPKLAELRISFYRDYPYLYEGNLVDEANYLSMYANSEDSLLAIAKKEVEIVGAVAGIPLLEFKEENKRLYAQKEIPAESIFYLGEIVLLQEYRNSDVQQRLYQQFEKALQDLEGYNAIIVCEIERGSDDPKKPESATSSEVLWENRGFVKQADLSTHYAWKDVGDEAATDHLMVFWSKEIL